MRKLLAGIFTLSLLWLVSPARPGHAQEAAGAVSSARLLDYDVSQEVTLKGTVAGVLTNPSPGMLAGSHLLLSTLTGLADISLGAFGLRGEGALSVGGGQPVEVTGVMKVFKGKPVLLARVVKVGDHVYAIRSEHGIPVTPQARERASQNVQNGETR